MKRTSALAVGFIAATALAMPGAAQAAPPAPTSPVGQAQTWLKSQLVDGAVPSSYGGANTGATIDAALSLHAVDADADLSAEVAAVAAGLDDGYADADESDCTDWAPDYSSCLGTFEFEQHGYYAGATGKALAFATATGQNTATFGGRNLLTQMEGLVQSSGRIQDDSYFGDYANVLGQAFAVAGLTAAGSGKATQARDFLLTQKCADGSFPEQFATTDKDASCAVAPRPGSVDTTATVILELHGLAGTDAALAAAGSWLLASQNPDGSWTSNGGENANATGLAARALHALGDDAAAANGASWLADHQLVNLGSCRTHPAADQGALAYDDAALANTSGGTATDQYRVAASQALPALAYVPDTKLGFAVPTVGAPVGASVTVSVSGLHQGQQLCVSGPGVQKIVTGSGSSVPLTLPVGASYTLTGRGVSTTLTLTAVSATPPATPLTRTRLGVHLRHQVHRGKTLLVTVTGLAAGEKATVQLANRKVRAVANASGTAVVRIKVARQAGPRRAVVKAVGSLPTREGTAKVRILR